MRPPSSPVLTATAILAALVACAPPSDTVPGAGGISSNAEATLVALPFVENDYPTALARAREAGLPLFVEVWAPW